MTDAMLSDKKNRDSRIVFELPHRIGNCEEVKLEKDFVIDLAEKTMKRC